MTSKRIPTTIAIATIFFFSGLNVNLKSASIKTISALAQSCSNTRIQTDGNKSRTFGRNTKWTTCNGYKLNFQGDGNLVLYPPSGEPLWATGTEGRATKLAVQSDGNVVLYDGNNKPIWATNTENNPGAYLAIQTDGNVVVYRKDGKPIWATNTDGGQKKTRSAASEWRAAFARPSQPKNPPNFNSVKFSGKAHRDGVNIRSSASLNSNVVGRLQPNQQVNFDGWIHSDVVDDVWTSKPDKRWYRIPGKGWVASAVINGNAPGSSRLPGSTRTSSTKVDVVGQPNFNKPEYRQENPLWRAGYAPKSVKPPIYRMSNPYAKGNCTWYASGRSKELGGNPKNVNKLVADAGNWDNQARGAGIQMSKTPQVGAIAQWEAANNNGFGHVAVVERVNGDGTILISESSYALSSPSSWDFLYRKRTISANSPSIYILP